MRHEGEGGGRRKAEGGVRCEAEGGRSAECWTGLRVRREAERRERGYGS